MKKHLLGIIAAVLIACLCSGAVAEGTVATVTFTRTPEEVIVFSPEDLFPNFKNAMPGDTLTQTIEVHHQRRSRRWIRVFLRAEPTDEEDKAFLEQLHMTVHNLNTGEIFNAVPSETAQLTENVLLGSFKNGSGTTLEVELTIPKDLGDEFQSARGNVYWTFTAEILPYDTGDTGDWFDLKLWAAAGGLVLGALLALLIVWRRRSSDEEPEEG